MMIANIYGRAAVSPRLEVAAAVAMKRQAAIDMSTFPYKSFTYDYGNPKIKGGTTQSMVLSRIKHGARTAHACACKRISVKSARNALERLEGRGLIIKIGRGEWVAA